MSTLTPPKGTFHSILFNKTLYTSYWGQMSGSGYSLWSYDPSEKIGDFSTGPPSSGNNGLDDGSLEIREC